MKTRIWFTLTTFFPLATCMAQTPAFPGAQGGGAGSRGGRGGIVCEVKNLNDSGANSFRYCVTRPEKRTVVFRVSGVIQLATGGIRIFHPFLTVAGQTAPGGGIEISGRDISENVILVYTHDVIWRYTRIRKGYNSGSPAGSQAGTIVYIANGSYNVIFDHNSFSWSQDECMNPWTNERSLKESRATHNVTLSWNLAAEGLKGHSTGLLIGANPGNGFTQNMTEIDAHHNLMMNFDHRLPLVQGTPDMRYVNNITYNWAYYAGQWLGSGSWDIIGNLFKAGPMTRGVKNIHEIQLSERGSPDQCCAPPSAYVAGNKGPHLTNSSGDNWTMVARVTGENGDETGPAPAIWRRNASLPREKFPIVADDVNQLENSLLPTVGASQRLDCVGNWVINRDSVDVRLVREYSSEQGMQPVNETQVGGFPVISNSESCADSDHDGIPDAWERKHHLSTHHRPQANEIGSDGYTNLERYLNGSPQISPEAPHGKATTAIHDQRKSHADSKRASTFRTFEDPR
jgi:pectate lyase